MADLAILLAGQSNPRAARPAIGGDQSIPANLMVYGDGEGQTGRRWRKAKFGEYPLDRRVSVGDPWANNMGLSFARAVAGSYNPRLAVVAKGAHPIESFLRFATRKTKSWPIPKGKTDLAPVIYPPRVGLKRGLAALEKAHFNVVLFHQGEANGLDSPRLYARKFLAFLEDLRLAGLITRQTPVICGTLSGLHPFYLGHKQAMQIVMNADMRVKFVELGDLPTLDDNIHFTGESLVIVGQRYAAAWQA